MNLKRSNQHQQTNHLSALILFVSMVAVFSFNASISSAAHTKNATSTKQTNNTNSYSCSQAASATYLPPRLQIGNRGRSIHVGNLNIRQQPGIESRIIGRLTPGTSFTVLEGPACAGDYVWWRVNTGRAQGWVAEGVSSSQVYWLEPSTSRSAMPSP